MYKNVNFGLFQKRFGGNNKIVAASVNLGCTRGKGSTTRMLNYCNKKTNNSECINKFITIK